MKKVVEYLADNPNVHGVMDFLGVLVIPILILVSGGHGDYFRFVVIIATITVSAPWIWALGPGVESIIIITVYHR
jgi:hypothetical protein